MRFCLLFCLFVFSLNSLAQEAISANNPIRPSSSIHKIDQAPTIDGEIRSDPIWQKLEPITEFLQQQPNFGAAVSEKTEVRIALDDRYLYIAAVMFDKDPEMLVVTDSRRDGSLEETDAIQFIFDTYHDTQNGFVFGTNPIGIQYDAQVDNEGQGNFDRSRNSGGMIGGFNINWDGTWDVETQTGSYGWSAEFRIPLKTIRFAVGQNKTWGLNMRRNIRKNFEIAYWALVPMTSTINRLSLAGDLTGLQLANQGNLKMIPFILSQSSRDYKNDTEQWNTDIDIGGDIKFSVTPSLTLDLTYNTDFAQVEVDDEQINLDRFNLFFPEKRPFFLENAGLFSVGSPGEIDLFFSRRIGIGEDGTLVPIIGGARLSGKIKNTNLGLLNMYTEDVEANNISGNTFTVARVNHEFAGSRSSLGAAFVNRFKTKDTGDDKNSVLAIDGKLGLGKKAYLSGFAALSETPGIDDGQNAFQMRADYNWDGWRNYIAYARLGEGFNPEVGFLQRSAFDKLEFLVFKTIRTKKNVLFGLLETRPHVAFRGYWGLDGFFQTGFLHVDNHWAWKSGYEVHTGVNFTKEGVQERFEIFSGVFVDPGTYDHAEAALVGWTNRSKPVSFSWRGTYGGFFGGDRIVNSFGLTIRIGDKFNSETSWNKFNIDLPNGSFTTNIVRTRLSYSFTPSIFIQGLIQYNEASDTFSTNLRFGWLRSAGSGLFVVFNEARNDFNLDNRIFTIKYSHIFDVLR